MSFLVISVADGLSPRAHRRAVRAGPSGVASRHDVATLVHAAGFSEVTTTDLTAQYLATARAWLAARERHRVELAALDRDRLRQQQHDMTAAVAAIEDGLLLRSLVTARRPARAVPSPRRGHRTLVRPRGGEHTAGNSGRGS